MTPQILLAILLASAAASLEKPDSDAARLADLAHTLRNTRSAIGAAHLVWTRTTIDYGFMIAGCSYARAGLFTGDVRGARLTIEAVDEPAIDNGDGTITVGPPATFVSTWNGILFTSSRDGGWKLTDVSLGCPRFPLHDNYLGLIFHSPAGDAASIRPEKIAPPAPPGAVRLVETDEYDGEPALRVDYLSNDGGWILHFATRRGGYLVAEEMYEVGRLVAERHVELSDALGVWFPTAIVERSFDRDGTVTLTNHWKLDLAQSWINGPRSETDNATP